VSVVNLRAEILGGGVTFSNRALRLTGGLGGDGPLWQIDPQPVRLEGRAPSIIHASFASVLDSYDGSSGSVGENEHGVTADFYFASPYFDLLQQAALSAADLEVTVTFAARNGRVEVLMLSIQHKIH
jgi:hypothetical protein